MRDGSVLALGEVFADRTGHEHLADTGHCGGGGGADVGGHQDLIVGLGHLLTVLGHVAHLVVGVDLPNELLAVHADPADEEVLVGGVVTALREGCIKLSEIKIWNFPDGEGGSAYLSRSQLL